jgi:hypothetical protein
MLAGFQNDVKIKGSTINLTILYTLHGTADKWAIPPQVWKAVLPNDT